MAGVRGVAEGAHVARLADARGSSAVLHAGSIVQTGVFIARFSVGVSGASIGAIAMAVAAHRTGAHHRPGDVLALGLRMADLLVVAGIRIGCRTVATVPDPARRTAAADV